MRHDIASVFAVVACLILIPLALFFLVGSILSAYYPILGILWIILAYQAYQGVKLLSHKRVDKDATRVYNRNHTDENKEPHQ